MTLKRLAILASICVFEGLAYGQQPPASSVAKDPQALALAQASMAALINAAQVNDITLVGTATRYAGSDVQNGSVALTAYGTYDSRLDLNLSGGAQSEVRTFPTTGPAGATIESDGSTHPMAQHNCQTDAVWFFPALSALSQIANPYMSVTYVGAEIFQGASVQHVRVFRQSPLLSADGNSSLAKLSAIDFYLDRSSALPIFEVFNGHPFPDAGADIVVEIAFSNYKIFSGVQIPTKITKYINGSLFLDIELQSATLNSGLTDSNFSTN